MSTIDSSTLHSNFFPQSNKKQIRRNRIEKGYIPRNIPSRKKEIENTTKEHAKVEIPHTVKDYAKIRKAVDDAAPLDHSEKIARLKKEIQNGQYKINYDDLADKILSAEF